MVRFSFSSVLFASALATASIACSAETQEQPEEKSSSSSDMKASCLSTVKKAGDAHAQIEAAKKCAAKGFDLSDLGSNETVTTDGNGVATVGEGNTQVPVSSDGKVAWGDFDFGSFDWDNASDIDWNDAGTAATPTGKVCSTQVRCTNGSCTCTGGSHKGQSCNGSVASGAGSCSEICSDCQ